MNDLLNDKLKDIEPNDGVYSFFDYGYVLDKDILEELQTYNNRELHRIFSILKKLCNFQVVDIPYKYEDIIKTINGILSDFIHKVIKERKTLPGRCFDKKITELENELNELKVD